MTQRFVYHWKTDDFKGSELIPLNELKNEHPKIFENAFKKYIGRESLTNYQLPILKCLWNDVIHLAPIHPFIVKRQIEALGGTPRLGIKWFKIPVEKLENTRSIYFQDDEVFRNDYNFKNAKITQFNVSEYCELTGVPAHTTHYFQREIPTSAD